VVDLGESLEEGIGHSFGNLTIAWLLLHRNQYIGKISHNRLIWKASFNFDRRFFKRADLSEINPILTSKTGERSAALKRHFQPDVPGWCRADLIRQVLKPITPEFCIYQPSVWRCTASSRGLQHSNFSMHAVGPCTLRGELLSAGTNKILSNTNQ